VSGWAGESGAGRTKWQKDPAAQIGHCAAKLSASVLLIIMLVLLSVGLSSGQAELPGNVQTTATDSAANLAVAPASSDHIKRNKSS
jgi:hypothetical protein